MMKAVLKIAFGAVIAALAGKITVAMVLPPDALPGLKEATELVVTVIGISTLSLLAALEKERANTRMTQERTEVGGEAG
jgi:hypothetical protein